MSEGILNKISEKAPEPVTRFGKSMVGIGRALKEWSSQETDYTHGEMRAYIAAEAFIGAVALGIGAFKAAHPEDVTMHARELPTYLKDQLSDVWGRMWEQRVFRTGLSDAFDGADRKFRFVGDNLSVGIENPHITPLDDGASVSLSLRELVTDMVVGNRTGVIQSPELSENTARQLLQSLEQLGNITREHIALRLGGAIALFGLSFGLLSEKFDNKLPAGDEKVVRTRIGEAIAKQVIALGNNF